MARRVPAGKKDSIGVVDYTLAKRALLRDFRRGLLSRFDICDAHPELLRAARYLGQRAHRPCPVCRNEELRLLAYVFADGLKRTLAHLGFHLVEHFIVCVRMVAFEQLMARQRLPLVVARRLVGIGDPTNARRQLKRARKRSGEAFLKLKSLVA